jgi:hypothetical protein
MIEEDEAKLQLCPETLSGTPRPCHGCICMAWRWRDHADDDDTKGYCGKAGRPSP